MVSKIRCCNVIVLGQMVYVLNPLWLPKRDGKTFVTICRDNGLQGVPLHRACAPPVLEVLPFDAPILAFFDFLAFFIFPFPLLFGALKDFGGSGREENLAFFGVSLASFFSKKKSKGVHKNSCPQNLVLPPFLCACVIGR